MPKVITDYLKQSCSAPLSTEEPSSFSAAETSSSQRTESDVQISNNTYKWGKIHKQKQWKHSSTMSVWSWLFFSTETIWKEKTQLSTYFLKHGTIWDDLNQARNDLKQPTTSKKYLKTTYNKQETTWNKLEWARNNLKRPTIIKKRLETTSNKQETTWNNL